MVDIFKEYEEKTMKIKEYGKNKVVFKKICKDRNVIIRNEIGLDGRQELYNFILNNSTFKTQFDMIHGYIEIITETNKIFVIKNLCGRIELELIPKK